MDDVIGRRCLRRSLVGLSAIILLASACTRAVARQLCEDLDDNGAGYTVCTVDTSRDTLHLYWRDSAGKPFQTYEQLAASLARMHEKLVFAMNAGMFQEDFSPLGLFIEGGQVRRAANTRDGAGNFHLKPNGVFFFGGRSDGGDANGANAGVMETQRFLRSDLRPAFATQSGPMLVIDGQIHPKIQPDGTSQKVRNGVGVRDARTVVFAISRDAVTFYQFASLFRDRLQCRNALFLDGSVSSLYAPELGRTQQWLPVGPMVGVTEKAP